MNTINTNRGINLTASQLISLTKNLREEEIRLYLVIWAYGDLTKENLTVDILSEDIKLSYRHTLKIVSQLKSKNLIDTKIKYNGVSKNTIISVINEINKIQEQK